MKTTRKLTMAAVGLLALVATTDLIMSPAMAQPPPGPPGGPPPGGGPRPGGGGGWIDPLLSAAPYWAAWRRLRGPVTGVNVGMRNAGSSTSTAGVTSAEFGFAVNSLTA